MPITPNENRESKSGSDNRKGHQAERDSEIVGSSDSNGVRFKLPKGNSPMTGHDSVKRETP